MNQREMDKLLAESLGQRFSLPKGAEDALWAEFGRRRAEERTAWAGFAAALVRAGTRVRETVSRPAWPATLPTSLAWR